MASRKCPVVKSLERLEGKYATIWHMEEEHKNKIDLIKEKDPSTWTPQERKLANLKPQRSDEPGRNPKGRKKGLKNWSTVFQRVLDDEAFFKKVISSSPKQWAGLIDDTPAEFIAGAYVASILQGLAKSAQEDGTFSIDKETRELITQLNKMTFGDKVVNSYDGFFEQPQFSIKVVNNREEVKQIEAEEKKEENEA